MAPEKIILATLKGDFDQLDALRQKIGDAPLFYLGIQTYGKVTIHCSSYKQAVNEVNKTMSNFTGQSVVVDFSEAVDEKNIPQNFEKFLSFINFDNIQKQYPDLLNKITDIFKEETFKDLFLVLEQVVLHAQNPNPNKYKLKLI